MNDNAPTPLPARHSIRLAGFDYSAACAYFVTICVHQRRHLFGQIVDGEMVMNDAGRMVADFYRRCELRFPAVACHDMVVMPNHFHGIFQIVNTITPESTQLSSDGQTLVSPTLGDVVQWLKTMTTNAYIKGVRDKGWHPFNGRLW